MNRIQITLLVGLGCFCNQLCAQKITVDGKVLDSLQQPLELANVLAIYKNSGAVASYGVTDANGRYKLLLNRDSTYLLKASYLGFETFEETFKATASKTKNMILKSAAEELEGVESVSYTHLTLPTNREV